MYYVYTLLLIKEKNKREEGRRNNEDILQLICIEAEKSESKVQ